MSIADELAQAKANLAASEQYLKAAYAALQSNGASLPAKCNMENLAEVIAENKYAGVALAIEGATVTLAASGELLLKSSGASSFAKDFILVCNVNGAKPNLSLSMPGGLGYSVYKEYVKSIYIDAGGVSVSQSGYLCGGGAAYNFSKLERLELKGLETVGDYLCQYATALTDVTLHEGLKNMGVYAFYGCKTLTKLKLPDGLLQVGYSFCGYCDNLQELYIPEGCAPPDDVNSLSTTNLSAPAYTNGIVLKGAGAKAWKEALPDRTSSPYRKLILDPEWS